MARENHETWLIQIPGTTTDSGDWLLEKKVGLRQSICNSNSNNDWIFL